MGGVIGETLPLGLGIALNPIAIVVAILILGTVNTPKNGIAFAFGWISGLTILLVLTAGRIEVERGRIRHVPARVV